jgi:hypothetical protein
MGRVVRFIKNHMRVVLFVMAVVGLLAVSFLADRMLATSGAPSCPQQQTGDIRTGQEPKWRLMIAPQEKLLLVLDHQVKDARHDDVSMNVAHLDDAAKTTRTAELPRDTAVGARLLRRPRASEPLAFPVVTRGEQSDDGQSIQVKACTTRPNRDTKPGRYKASVRVGGTGIVPAEVPLEVTIRAGVRSTLIIAVLAALIACALTHYGTPVQTKLKGSRRTALLVLAWVMGLIGGLAAAYLAYDADPTWGADRAKDMVGLFVATATAASAAMSAAGAGAKVVVGRN